MSIFKKHINIDPFILESEVKYYASLSNEDKDKFIKRLEHFVNEKEFLSRGGIEITDKIKVLICSAAIQLTFGLKEYLLPLFDSIIIYPEAFLSESDNLYHKGETNTHGAIVFSWHDFEEGNSIALDKVNLGLHEWAHALMITNFFENGRDWSFHDFYRYWAIESNDEFSKAGEDGSIFREYGGTNTSEFFAVCVEVFFESPEEFYKQAPALFKYLCSLLNQYPLGDLRRHQDKIANIEPKLVETANAILLGGARKISTLKSIIYWTLLILTVAVVGAFFIAGRVQDTRVIGLVFILLLFTSVFNILTFIRQKYFPGKSLYLFDDHLTIIDKKGIIIKEYFFEDIASLGIELKNRSSDYSLEISYPEAGHLKIERIPVIISPDEVDNLIKAMS